MAEYRREILSALQQFYSALDKHISHIEEKNKERINCRKGCFSCCKDDLEVFGIEAENIRLNYPEIIQNELPHPAGMCAFLDHSGACRVYESRPYICRTHGVPIAYLEEDQDGAYEFRDICPLNEEGEPLENLKAEKVFQNSVWEEKLAILQIHGDKGNMHRIKLRELFNKSVI